MKNLYNNLICGVDSSVSRMVYKNGGPEQRNADSEKKSDRVDEVKHIERMQGLLEEDERRFEQNLLKVKNSPDPAVKKMHREFMMTFSIGKEKINKKSSLVKRLGGKLNLIGNLNDLMGSITKKTIKFKSGGKEILIKSASIKDTKRYLERLKVHPDWDLAHEEDLDYKSDHYSIYHIIDGVKDYLNSDDLYKYCDQLMNGEGERLDKFKEFYDALTVDITGDKDNPPKVLNEQDRAKLLKWIENLRD